ncbi:MAG: quinohemoprotein amine dehydrogenase subunit gamma [Gemmatimonadaceae bacterium]
MKHVNAVNKKARRIEALQQTPDVVALQQGQGGGEGPHIPLGCSFVFSPGWETDSSGGTAGLCQPVERDLYDCYITCFWPAHVPDLYNHAPDWSAKCASAQKDWRKIDLVFP